MFGSGDFRFIEKFIKIAAIPILVLTLIVVFLSGMYVGLNM